MARGNDANIRSCRDECAIVPMCGHALACRPPLTWNAYPMGKREVQMLIEAGNGTGFSVSVEPEAMQYDFPPQEKVLLTFVMPETPTQYFNVAHFPDHLVIWRPADTEVWVTLADGRHEQIGGWEDNPAPWLDSASELAGRQPPWDWPPSSPNETHD